jgi:energy-coupling factor transporter transmembrane protein EcfT
MIEFVFIMRIIIFIRMIIIFMMIEFVFLMMIIIFIMIEIVFLMSKRNFLMRIIVFMMMKIATICRFDLLIGILSALSRNWEAGECWIAGCKTTLSNKEGIKLFSIAVGLVEQRKK